MDSLVHAAAAVLDSRRDGATRDEPVRIVLLPTAVARHRPDLAAANGRRAFEASGARLGISLHVDVAPVLDRAAAADPRNAVLLARADLVHLPGGDPDLVPMVLRDTPAWAAVLRAFGRGACVAGASAGAMALADRLWTRDGPAVGLGLVAGIAVLPHFDLGRLAAWRAAVDPAAELAWLGLDERTLVIGPTDGPWTVHGAGRALLVLPGASGPSTAATNGGSLGPVVG